MTALYVLLGIVCVLLCTFLYSLYPGKKRNTIPFDRLPIAHRGLHTKNDNAPENSLTAFSRAKQAGYAVELDIQFTADKKIVVFHDATLERVCGIDRRVDSLTYAELSHITLQNSDEHIPLLEEALEILDGTPLVCEIKSYGANSDTSLCAAAWPILSTYRGPLCVESFNPFMIQWFYKNHPEIIRGILSTCYDDVEEVNFWQGIALTALMTNFLTKPDFIAYDYEYRHKLPFRICRALYHPTCIAWTITDNEQQQNSQKLFDNVIFEQYQPLLAERSR